MPTKQFLLSFGQVEILFVNSVDDCDESVGGFEGIGGIVCLRGWKIVLRVDVCSDGTLIAIVGDATQSKAMWFDRDRFVGVGLEQACRRQETDLDVGDVVRWDFDDSEVAKLIVHSPGYFALTLNLQTLWRCLSVE